ncbi:MAG TPA: ATP-binding protein [Acidimicrobiales bacterium]|nr:ATP-binding protein [Acidimicrobiales bacterium]
MTTTPDPAPASTAAETSALALLIVDDIADNLIALEAALEPLGHRIVTAHSGEEALRYLLKDEFAAVVLDVQMPGLDGFETAEAIRGRERTSGIPIIFLTAIGREHEHHMRGFSAGAVDYLLKPVDPELLRAKVGVFVRLRTIELELRAKSEELERRAADLARSNADLDQFASVVSHDLLDPVNVISGYLELLRDRLGPSLEGEPAEWVERITGCAQRVHSLVQDLLEYSRAASAGAASGRSSVNLADAAADAMDNLASLISSQGEGGSTVDIPAQLPSVSVNRNELGRVFQNLIANAVQHGGRPVHVAVSAVQDNGEVTVRVTDDGTGLAPDQMQRVFGMFERAGDQGPQPRTGLGLAICRRIVNRAGGRIWMEPNEAAGVSVFFTLPAAHGSAGAAPEPGSP